MAEKGKVSVRAKSLPPNCDRGGASLPEGEANIRLWKSALLGIGEEQAATGIAAGTGKPDDSGGSWRADAEASRPTNPSAGGLRTRYSPAGGEITERKPSVVRARNASHTRTPGQEPRDRQGRSLFRVSLVSSACRKCGMKLQAGAHLPPGRLGQAPSPPASRRPPHLSRGLPADLTAYTMKAPERIKRAAALHGPSVAEFADRLSEGPLP